MSEYIMCNECKMCEGDRCTYFDNDSDRESTLACILFEPKNPTVFDHITSSPKVLAQKLVYWTLIEYDGKIHTHLMSTITGDVIYDSEPDAIAATVEKLKEVEK